MVVSTIQIIDPIRPVQVVIKY